MNKSILAATLALAFAPAFAQAPAGTVQRPSQETAPTKSSGMPAAKAQNKVDARSGNTADAATMGAAGTTTGMGMMKGMDANGDGMVSKQEWEAHHAAMWTKMSKNGMVSMTDMRTMMGGGPN